MTKSIFEWFSYQEYLSLVITFSDEVAKIEFLLLPLGTYLFRVMISNRYRYLARGSQEIVLSVTITKSVTVSR